MVATFMSDALSRRSKVLRTALKEIGVRSVFDDRQQMGMSKPLKGHQSGKTACFSMCCI